MNTKYPIKTTAILVSVFWTFILIVSVCWNIAWHYDEVSDQVKLQAKSFIDKDLSFRAWVAANGGVYVKPTEKNPPNIYLKVPDRDVLTTEGMALTLVNPASMMRQVLDDYSKHFGITGHMTSLTPINPVNAPGQWERQALQRFEQGITEVGELVEFQGKREFRYIRPLYVDQSCLKCHEEQGYVVGDIRGGISTTIDMTPYETHAWHFAEMMLISHGGIWLMGLVTIGGSTRWLKLHAARISQAEAQSLEFERLYLELKSEQALDDAVRENAERFHAVMVATLDGFVIVDLKDRLIEVNQNFCDLLGYTREELLKMSIRDIESRESPLDTRRLFAGMVGRERERFEVLLLRKDGKTIAVEVNACYQPIEGGLVYSFLREIAVCKQLEA